MLKEQILLNSEDNLNIREFKKKHFEIPWHSHDEYELVYIVSGSGKKFVNDAIIPFNDGDLSFIGVNVPHFFLADEQYYENDEKYCHWWVLQFPLIIFPSHMNQLSAFQSIHNILTLSSQGINFTSVEVCGQVFKSLKKIYSLNGLERITSLYHLLHFLGNTPSAQTMTNNQHFFNSNSPNDIVDKIYKYLINNFQNEIHLNDLAQIVNLRTSTLCMYFKRHTLKSIFETLNEIRISHSCKLLTNTRFNIKQIAMEAGFNNVAYFNRQFLRLKKQSPGAYRKNQKDYLPE